MADNISAISYTNKDFQTIYPELLDLATRISKRWTPDQTNESDPGIVLAKIAALCADKNNYNIDKNVLEYFPSSVTQMPNAREVFAQRGYYMHWYQAAEGEITLAVKSGSDIADSSNYTSVRISGAPFPTITGSDGKIVYTIKPDSADNDIKKDGTPRTFEVIQGAAKQYQTTGGSSTITVADLDAERRLYFPNTSVAENGIFISHEDDSKDWRDWERVASVDAEPIGDNRFIYEFGVSRDGSNCYIQFPDNITSIIGNGIEIWYVESIGVSGNIPAFYLTKFANDMQGETLGRETGAPETVSLNSDNIVFSQSSSIANGANPETIEEAYRAYTKTVGTFDTLVTIRDYDNALTKAPDVSNGFVTDRTNDIQRAYQIISEQNNVNVVLDHTHETTDETTKDTTVDMLAFDLCVYEFDNMPQTSTWADSDYNSTFEMLANYDDKIDTKINSLKSYFEQNNKSIQHDFVTWKQDRPLCIKNKYNVVCKIIPQYSVTELQANEIKNNITQALYKNLNSSKIDFGEEITFERVYNIIADSDERIKSVSLGNIEFTPWIVYWDGGDEPKEIPIKSLSAYTGATSGDTKKAEDFEIEIFAKSILSGHTPLFNLDKNINYSLAQTTINNIAGATTVTTETKLPIDTTATTLLDGESIIFYAPSMIADTTYSLGVKYVVSDDVTAESISNVNGFVALWKKDGKFYAHKYANAYIQPDFALSQTSSELYKSVFGGVTTTGVDVDVSGVGNIVNNWKSISGIQAGNSISAMVENAQKTADSDYCSWMLNSAANKTEDQPNGEWVLFPSYSASFPFEDTWKDGNGNWLQFTTSGENITVSGNISKTDISATTISVTGTANATFKFPSQGESQIEYQLTIGGWSMTVKFGDTSLVLSHETITQQRSLAPGEYFITSDSQKQNMTIFGAGTLLSRELTGNAEKLSIPAYSYATDWTSDGMSAIASDRLKTGVVIKATEREYVAVGAGGSVKSTDIEYSVEVSNTEIPVDATKIQYGDGATPSLSLKQRASAIGWTARSFLAFNTMDGAMKLASDRQSVTFTIVNEVATSKKVVTGDANNPWFIQTSPQYNMLGGVGLSLQYVTSDSKTLKSPDVVVYQNQSFTKESGITLSDDGSIILSQSSSGSVNFTIPRVGYDRVFKVQKSEDSTFHINYNTETQTDDVKPIKDENSDKPYKQTLYYNIKKNVAQTYNITYNSGTSITISPLYRVKDVDPKVITNAANDAVYRKVIELDQNGEFNYMYDVLAEKLIKDPLLGESFVNVEHPYNQFTMCQMNTDKSSVEIFNKLSSR